ncbi:MAG: hypothetical protein RQM92_08825 [Candidatus Syntrophopropionicum ammoniitolerans]
MKEFLVLSPTAILGYGFPLSSLKEGLNHRPMLLLWMRDQLTRGTII